MDDYNAMRPVYLQLYQKESSTVEVELSRPDPISLLHRFIPSSQQSAWLINICHISNNSNSKHLLKAFYVSGTIQYNTFLYKPQTTPFLHSL
jgi:hypothetical protein